MPKTKKVEPPQAASRLPATVRTGDVDARLARAGALERPIAELLAARAYDGELVLSDGPTTVSGAFRVGAVPIVVDGDLDVAGCLEDCDGCDSSLLVVLGSCRTRDVLTCSEVVIAGDLVVARAVVGDSLGDGTLLVGGTLRAAAVVENGHRFQILGALEAPAIHESCRNDALLERGRFDAAGDFRGQLVRARGRLRPTLEDADGLPELRKLVRAVKRGEPLFC